VRIWRDLQSGTEFHNWVNIFLAHFLSNKEKGMLLELAGGVCLCVYCNFWTSWPVFITLGMNIKSVLAISVVYFW